MALMDANGINKANAICAQLDGISFSHNDIADKIMSESNLILDESGMLGTKTREGINDIAKSVRALIKSKNNLKNQIMNHGNMLYYNYPP